ncbi:MAG: hypothetical protein EP326_04835, partial [Deltaproteobacteria bacterium]
MKKIISTFFVFFSIPLSQAQIVTSSFDPTIFNFNPAANSSRVFDGFFSQISSKKIETKGRETGNNSQLNLTNQNADWEVEDRSNSLRLLYADKETKWKLIPETYLVVEDLKTTWVRTDNTGTDPKATFYQDNIVYNLLHNSAYKVNDYFVLGITLGYTKISQKENQNHQIGGNSFSEIRDMDADMMASGLGFTWKLHQNFFFGGAYNLIKLGQKTVQSGTNSSTMDQDFTFKGYNFGIAWHYGDVKSKAFKIELSQRSNSQEVTRLKNGVKRTLSLEGMNEKYYVSGSIAQVKGESINFQSIIEAFLGERVSSNDSKLVYSVGGGFRTKSGHSFGGSAVYSTEEMPAQVSKLNQAKFNSETKT